MNTLIFWRDTLGIGALCLYCYAAVYFVGAVMQG